MFKAAEREAKKDIKAYRKYKKHLTMQVTVFRCFTDQLCCIKEIQTEEFIAFRED